MASVEFDISGLDELVEDFTKFQTQFPDQANQSLRTLSNRFCRDVAKKEPTYDKVLKTKNWKKEFSGRFAMGVIQVDIYNTHPLHHLLENGHDEWFMGKQMNKFVPGKHYTEKTRQEWETEGLVAKNLDEILNRAMKKVNL